MKKVKWIAISFIVFAVYFLALEGIGFYHMKNEIVSNVHFEFFWHKSSQTYIIKGTNVSGKALEDNGEMIDVVIPTKYHGRPVTHIGWDSFRECQILRSVTIPEGIKGISANVFFDCNNLESVHLPKSMRDFYGSSFASCNSLKEVTVDPDNPWFCSVDGVVYTKDKKELVFYPPGKEDVEFVVPEGCLVIGRGAIAYCENLKRIIISNTVTEISDESIDFCKGLEGVVVDEDNETYCSIDGNLYSKDMKKFLGFYVSTGNTNLTIPEGVVEIAECAASYCYNLTGINLPKSLTSIGDSSFVRCDNLTSVIIPENVTFIGEGAFYKCNNLSSVVFEQTSGWSVEPQGGKFLSTKKLDKAKINSSATAAKYVSETYYSWEWHREN